jgi:hypothetical protein
VNEAEAREWQQRLRARVAESARRRAVRASTRLAASRRRVHGLIDRQAARLARHRKPSEGSLWAADVRCTE